MIHCLDDSGNPITILDLCGYSVQEASDMLVSLRAEMVTNQERWERKPDDHSMSGVRVIIEHPRPYGDSMERHPLEDQRELSYGLNEDFGLATCWFGCVTDKTGPFKGVPRLMFVVRPDKDFKSSLSAPAIREAIADEMVSTVEQIPIVGKLISMVKLIAYDNVLTKEEMT